MKILKFLLCVISLVVVYVLYTNSVSTYAHTSNLGIEGWDGIDYDECEPYSATTTETTSSYGEKWYGLRRILNGVNRSSHIDDDLYTLYYKIINDGSSDNSYWVENYDTMKAIIESGIKMWNYTASYEMNDDGYLEVIPIVNLVNVDTLEDPTSVDINIEVHLDDDETVSYSGTTICDYDTEVVEDRQEYNGISHIHYTKYIITLYPAIYDGLYQMMDAMLRTATHEIGHVFGLIDLDDVELNLGAWYHHQEILMGYSANGTMATDNITYRDLAGALITRGVHQNTEHQWLYDSESSSEGNYKMICSICNCVKYFDEINDCDWLLYKSCNNDHSLESGNIMPVGRFLNKDYVKCKYCRYVYAFCDNVSHNYLYYDDCDEDYHFAYSNTGGINYIVKEQHKYNVELPNGKKRCYLCPRCDDGSIDITYDMQVNTECFMSQENINITLNANESKLIKINSECANYFTIVASSNAKITFELFNWNFEKVDINPTITYTTTYLYKKFFKNDYYLRVRFTDENHSGDIELSISSNETYCQTQIDYLESKSIYNNMHNNHKEFIYNDEVDRFVEIKLLIETTDRYILVPEGVISVYDSEGNLVSKYKTDITDIARTKNFQYSLCVFLEKQKDYIIKIDYNNPNTINAELYIKAIDMIDYDCNENPNIDVKNTDDAFIDYFIRLNASQVGRYKASLSFVGEDVGNLNLTVVRRGIDGDNNIFYTIDSVTFTDSASDIIELEFNYTPNSWYYIGFFGGTVNGTVNVDLIRMITNETMDVLVEPGIGYDYGSEVRLNGGARRSTLITEGHTRLLYFSTRYAPSASRLRYCWYSSNPDVLEVSEYGTLLAKKVTEDTDVYVTAVYKGDMSKVFQILMTVKKETKTDPKIIRYSNIQINVGDKFQPVPDDRWPATYLQYYDWNVNDESLVNLMVWGSIKAKASGSVILTGDYKLNSRYTVIIEINIV